MINSRETLVYSEVTIATELYTNKMKIILNNQYKQTDRKTKVKILSVCNACHISY